MESQLPWHFLQILTPQALQMNKKPNLWRLDLSQKLQGSFIQM